MEEFDLDEIVFPTLYLDAATIVAIKALFDNITTAAIDSLYNAAVLNEEGIYPGVWHNDNSPDQGFNKQHLAEDFEKLKTFMGEAAAEGDYVLVYGR